MRAETLPPFLRGVPEVKTYDGVRALLKSKSVEPATHEESRDFVGGAVVTLGGEEHFDRRRLESAVWTREALKDYERSILTPTIDRCLADVAAPAGVALPSCDLKQLVGRMLLEIGAALVGLDDVDSEERTERLRQARDPLMLATIVEFELEDHGPIIAEGLKWKAVFKQEFVLPARERRQARIEALRAAGDSDGLARIEGTDLITQMLLHWDERWDEDLLVRECILYLVASGHTTTTAITHAVKELSDWFAAHPEDLHLRTEPEFLLRAAMETVRLHSPTPGILRRAIEPVEFEDGGDVVSLRPGDLVSGNISAASRDERHFGEGWARFDPHREVDRATSRYGAAFGGGQHVCIGRQLVLGSYARDEEAGEYLGIFVRILRRLYEVGIRIPEGAEPRAADSSHDRYEDFRVVFDDLDSVLAAA